MTDQDQYSYVNSPNPSPGCHWWNRWWHRRLREADKRMMIPILLGQVAEGDHQNRVKIFYSFIHDRGQEHWLCGCSGGERADLSETL